MRTLLRLGLCLALAAAAAAAAPDGGGVSVTQAKTALDGLKAWPMISITRTIVMGDDGMENYLDTPGRMVTGFVASDDAIRDMLKQVGRFAGIALQNDSFTEALFNYSMVPGKPWTTEALREAAPLQLKTLNGELLNITEDPKFPGGIAVNGFPLTSVNNKTTVDKNAMLHIVDGVLIPPSQRPQLDFWLANGNGPPKGAAADAAGAAAAAPATAAPAPATAGGRGTRATAAAAAVGGALLLAMVL